MITLLENLGTEINSTIPFTDTDLNNLMTLGSLIKSNTSLITTDLYNDLSNMMNNQLKLIEDGVTNVNPYLINLLDLQLFVAMYNLI